MKRYLEISKLVKIILSCVSALSFAYYLSLRNIVIFIVLFVVVFAIMYILIIDKGIDIYNMLERNEKIVITIFVVLFSLSLVIGFNINYSSDIKIYQKESDYHILSILDLIVFIVNDISLFLIFSSLYYLLFKRKSKNLDDETSSNYIVIKIKEYIFRKTDKSIINLGKVDIKLWLLCATISFLLFLPYLLTYYPGIIFGDTTASLASGWPYSNHHTVLYTALVRFFYLGLNAFGINSTFGLALFSIIQMLLFALCISYLYSWIAKRFQFRYYLVYIFVIFTSMLPYVATYSVAFWKDPLFNASLVIFVLKCFDLYMFIKNDFKISNKWWILYVFFAFFVIFLRNNGILIIFFTFIALFIVLLIKLKNKMLLKDSLKKATGITFTLLIVSSLIIGPLYSALGVLKDKEEAFGIPINQLCRIYLDNGNLDEDDLDFINSLIPLEDINEYYYPFCVDQVKWSPNFNRSAINSSFVPKYLKIVFKNLVPAFKAYLSLTFGYWAVNNSASYDFVDNIMAGAPWNIMPETNHRLEIGFKIDAYNLFQDTKTFDMFPLKANSIPESIINWVLVILLLLSIKNRKWEIVFCFVPLIGLILTLLIASPIWYWPRYEFAAQLLVPFILCMFYYLYQESKVQNSLKNK